MTIDELTRIMKSSAILSAISEYQSIGEATEMTIEAPKAQSADGDCITDEQAIEHLKSTGWMQNHDKQMYESGLREQLADDSGSYDALIPSEDTISRQAAIDAVCSVCGVDCDKSEFVYGGKQEDQVILCPEHYALTQLLSAQPEQQWIPCSERLPEEHIGFYLVTVQKRRITALNVVGCDNTVHDIDIARWDYDRRAPQRGYHWCKADKVIAWMPLPEPYGGEQK